LNQSGDHAKVEKWENKKNWFDLVCFGLILEAGRTDGGKDEG